MTKQIVRILVEDAETKEVKRYVSFEAESFDLRLEVARCFDAMQVSLSTYHADQVLQTEEMDVVLIDMAIALYESYRLADSFAEPWSDLAPRERNAWLAVAKRRGHLAIVLDTPKVKQDAKEATLDLVRQNAIDALRNGTAIEEVAAALADHINDDKTTVVDMSQTFV